MQSNRRVTYIEAGSAIQAFLPQASFNLTHIKNNMHAKHHRQDLHDWWNPFRARRIVEIQSAEDYDIYYMGQKKRVSIGELPFGGLW